MLTKMVGYDGLLYFCYNLNYSGLTQPNVMYFAHLIKLKVSYTQNMLYSF